MSVAFFDWLTTPWGDFYEYKPCSHDDHLHTSLIIMAVHHHTTFGTIKKERDRSQVHSPSCTFNTNSSQQNFTNQSSPFPLLTGGEKTLGGFEHKLEDLDMDLAKFLGEPEICGEPFTLLIVVKGHHRCAWN